MSSQSNESKSNRSVASMGIGDAVPVPTKPVAKPAVSDVPHLIPEGASVVNEPVFDSIVYLIYCGEHDKVAVNNVDKCKCTWLPFVALPDGLTWQRASDEGVNLLIGPTEAEMDVEENRPVPPVYQMTFLQILRIQLPSGKFVLRLTRFVHLEPNQGFLCCRNTDRVNWLTASQVLNDQVNKVWGPELRMFANMLISPNSPRIVSEFTMRNAQFYLNHQGSWEQKVLKAAKISSHHLSEIYTDYIEHCYPSFYMCLESFRAYLTKYGNVPDQTRLTRLYYAFAFTRRSFLDFHEFIVGLAVLEPTCSSKLEARSHFIFRYYDLEHKGYLNSQSITVLLKDANPSWTDTVVNNELNRLFQSAKVKSATNVSYEDFLRMFHSQLDNQLNLLCRSPKSIFNQISPALANRAKERDKAIAVTEQVLKSKRTTKGTCWSCRVQQYEYGNHLVTIDTIGRCVESTIINNQALKDLSTQKSVNDSIARSRYSLEYVFAIGSVPNIFIDLIRGFYHRKSNQIGLMAAPDEWSTFVKYLRILLNELLGLLASECKLVKVNAPAIVIGDLLGNLTDLMQLECHFFTSFPVIPENLIFLGNYSGDRGHSIECLIYLFALKLCSPNKVVLLRGANEMAHRTSETLKKEAMAKYGQANGTNIYNMLLDIFARLPIASVVEDNILCTHSGIPSAARLNALFKLPKEMKHLERDEPMAAEYITRFPNNSKPSVNSLNVSNVSKILFGAKTDNKFHLSTKSTPISKFTKSGRAIKSSDKCTSAVASSLIKSTKSNRKSSASSKSKKSSKKSITATKSGKKVILMEKSKGSASNKSSKESRKKSLTKSDKKCTSIKSGPIKSTKSIKSVKSNGSSKSPSKSLKIDSSKLNCKSIKSAKNSFESIKSSKSAVKSGISSTTSSIISTGTLSKLVSAKSTESNSSGKLKSSTKYKPGTSMLKSKGKPMFLNSVKGPNPRKINKNSGDKQAIGKSVKKSGKDAKPAKLSLSRHTFDHEELSDFLEASELQFLLRSHSACAQGYKIEFKQQCLTLFSCSNYDGKQNNFGAVALINGSDYNIRFVRYNFSCIQPSM